MYVRCNLYYFLREIVKHHLALPTLIWVDMLCIEQNTKERNHQVQNMKNTFARAQKVLAWIGPPDTAAKAVFQELQSSGSWSVLNLEPLRQICSRTYWNRMWMIQELCLAKHVQIICGRFAVPWDKWKDMLRDIETANTSHEENICNTPGGVLASFSDHFQNHVLSTDLAEHVLTFQHFKCSQTHDKVYALLGLVPDTSVLRVDYDRSMDDLLLTLLAGMPRKQALPPLQSLAQALDISLANFQLRLELRLRAHDLQSRSATVGSSTTQRAGLKESEDEALAMFLHGLHPCTLSEGSLCKGDPSLNLSKELFETLDAGEVYSCHCILCQDTEAAAATIVTNPESSSDSTVTDGTLYQIFQLASEDIALLYQDNRYIATYALLPSQSTMPAVHNSIADSSVRSCILFHDRNLARHSKHHAPIPRSGGDRLAMPFISICNLINHQSKPITGLQRLAQDEHYLGHVTKQGRKEAKARRTQGAGGASQILAREAAAAMAVMLRSESQ